MFTPRNMPTVAIIGAGDLGGTLAYTLCLRDRITEVRLVDERADLAVGKALDIQQAGSVERFDTKLRTSGDLAMAVGANVVVLADTAGARPTEYTDGTGLAQLRRVIEQDRDAVVVCAGAWQQPLIQQAILDGFVDRQRIVGSAPAALASAIRAIVALEADCSPRDVALSVLGLPPTAAVVTWDSATVGAAPIADALSAHAVARIKARVAHLWPPGPYALAAAASGVCEAIASGHSRPAFSCFCGLERQQSDRVVAVQVRLDGQGICERLSPPLSPGERVEFDSALARA